MNLGKGFEPFKSPGKNLNILPYYPEQVSTVVDLKVLKRRTFRKLRHYSLAPLGYARFRMFLFLLDEFFRCFHNFFG